MHVKKRQFERGRDSFGLRRERGREREEYKFWSVSHFGRDELLLSFSLFFLSFFLSSSIHTHFIIKLFGLQVEWVFINLHTYFFVVVLRNQQSLESPCSSLQFFPPFLSATWFHCFNLFSLTNQYQYHFPALILFFLRSFWEL